MTRLRNKASQIHFTVAQENLRPCQIGLCVGKSKWSHFSYHLLSGAVLPEYTRVRVPDDHAIADLAMYNYIEVMHIYSLIALCETCYISPLSAFWDLSAAAFVKVGLELFYIHKS